MIDVLREHDVMAAQRAITQAEAVLAGTAPVFGGKQGLPAFTGFIDRQTDVIHPPETESAAERRLWDSLESRIGQ